MREGLALLVALPEEARGILKVGSWRRVPSSASLATYEGHVGGVEVVLAISGVGRVRAEATAHEVLKKHSLGTVLSLGFAGGLVSGQRAGDLIVADTLVPAHGVPNGEQQPCGGEPLASDRALTNEALRVLAALGLRHQTGACVTASQIVSHPEAKKRLGLVTGALAVEEESFWIGLACRDRSVPFLAIRSIVDAAERPLPAFAARFALDATLRSRWRHSLPVMLRPWSIPALIRLGKAASGARDSLTEFALGFLRSRTRAVKA